MQGIVTKYLPPTNTKGARIVATGASGKTRSIIEFPSHMEIITAHILAAKILAAKLDWAGKMVTGATPTGYAHIFINASNTFTVGKKPKAKKRS